MKILIFIFSIIFFFSFFINPFFINNSIGNYNNNFGLWSIETIDGNGVGWYTDISIIDSNNIYITYYDINGKNLKIAKLLDSKWSLEKIDTIGDIGLYSSLDIDNDDKPHISYYDQTNNDLKYAKLINKNWSIQTIDYDNDVGLDTSIAIDSNNNPHISYYDSTNGNLKYLLRLTKAHCSCCLFSRSQRYRRSIPSSLLTCGCQLKCALALDVSLI